MTSVLSVLHQTDTKKGEYPYIFTELSLKQTEVILLPEHQQTRWL